MCAMLMLSGCAQHHNDNKEVKVSLPREFNTNQLDAQGFDAPMPVYIAIYQPLVTYGKNGKIEPGLATSWEASEDGKHYLFHLKKNVKFNDGSDFDASAVKFSIERAKATDTTDPMETLDKLKSITIKDKHTVEIELKSPSNQVLNELSQVRPLRIMSQHAVKGGNTTGKFEKAIGTGPFKVADSTNETVSFQPNTYYRNGHPLNYNLTFQSIEDSDSRHLAIESHSIDITGGSLRQFKLKDRIYVQVKEILAPLMTITINNFIHLFSRVIILEVIFSISGLGKLLINSINLRDYPVILGILMMIITFIMVLNFFGDVLLEKSDPRLRMSKKSGGRIAYED